MKTPIFNLGQGTHIIGTSGKGKSHLLKTEAQRLGITYEELLQRWNLPRNKKNIS